MCRVFSSGDFVPRQSSFKDDSAKRCSSSLPAHSTIDGKTCSTIVLGKRNAQAYLVPACLIESGLLTLTVKLLLSAWRQDEGGQICSPNPQAYWADSPVVPHCQRCWPPLLLAGMVGWSFMPRGSINYRINLHLSATCSSWPPPRSYLTLLCISLHCGWGKRDRRCSRG